MTDTERAIRAAIDAHETSYAQKHSGTAMGAWRWMCSCGEACDLCSWNECRDKTHDHWAKMLLPLFQSATERATEDMYSQTEMQRVIDAAHESEQSAIAGAYAAAAKAMCIHCARGDVPTLGTVGGRYWHGDRTYCDASKIRALTPADARQAHGDAVMERAKYLSGAAIESIQAEHRGELRAALASAEARGRLEILQHLKWAMDSLHKAEGMQHLVNGKAACRYCDGLFTPAGNPKKRRFVHKSDCSYDAAARSLTPDAPKETV